MRVAPRWLFGVSLLVLSGCFASHESREWEPATLSDPESYLGCTYLSAAVGNWGYTMYAQVDGGWVSVDLFLGSGHMAARFYDVVEPDHVRALDLDYEPASWADDVTGAWSEIDRDTLLLRVDLRLYFADRVIELRGVVGGSLDCWHRAPLGI